MKALRFTWACLKYLWNGDDRYFFPDTKNGENTMTAKITQTGDKFALTDKSGTVIKTYSRARDARRGADRLGLVIA